MSRPAKPYDNASCESSIKTLKREEIYANDYVDLDHLHNRCGLHSALGYQPPEEFEQQLESTATNAGATMSFFRHGEDYRPDVAVAKSGPQAAPLTIGFDESPAGYSWRVGLQQGSPPLHQLREILKHKR